MSYYTREQKKVMGYLAMANVHYHKNMWSRSRQLGYTHKSSPVDEIHIASDIDRDVKKVVLLHEVGHVYFNHNSVNIKQEMVSVKEIFEKYGIPYIKGIRHFGGPMSFLNICMDLEVNSKLLTLANVKTMYDNNFKILTHKSMDVPILDGFRDYYEVLISQLKDKIDERKEQRANGNQNGESDKNQQKGNGKSSKGSAGISDDIDDFLDDEEGSGVPDGMKDISSDVDPMDSDLDKEIGKALREENYENPDDKTPETEKSVEESLNSEDEGQEVDYVEISSNRGFGVGNIGGVTGKIQVVPNNSKEISRFFSNIIKRSTAYKINHIKHYNRGSRGNSNIMYSAVSTVQRFKKAKLGVLIDVSGSMSTESILKACSTLSSMSGSLAPDSFAVTWDTGKLEEFDFRHVPESVELGGGTRLLPGLQYLVNEKKCDTVVIYSDFFDFGLSDMADLVKKEKVNLYSIQVTDAYSVNNPPMGEDDWNNYLKANQGIIKVI